MAKCPSCGAPMPKGQFICEYCGAQAQPGSAGKMQAEVKPENIEKSTKLFKEINEAGKSGSAEAIQSSMGAMSSLSSVFGVLYGVIKPFEPIIKVIGNLFDVMGGAMMKTLMPALMPLIKLLLQLAPVFQVIGTVLGWLIGTVLKGILWVIYGIARAIAFFVDLFSWLWGAPGSAGRAVDAFFAPVLGSYQYGTDSVPQTGPYLLHQGEQVIPKDDYVMEELLSVSKQNLYYQKLLWQRKQSQW